MIIYRFRKIRGFLDEEIDGRIILK